MILLRSGVGVKHIMWEWDYSAFVPDSKVYKYMPQIIGLNNRPPLNLTAK